MTIDIRPGDVLFVWGRGFIPDAIEFVTHGPSHVALFKTPDIVIEADSGRSLGERPFSFYDDYDIEIWRDYTLTDAEAAAMIEYAATLYGTPYDYALIPVELAHETLGTPTAWYHEHGRLICSTFIADDADHVGKRWARRINPAPIDIMTSGALNLVYRRRSGEWETVLARPSA